MEPYAGVRDQYLRFADEALEDSPTFVEWANGVADDADVLTWIDALPGLKKQPNLVFAAARWHGVPAPGPYAGLRRALLADDGPIRATILARSTQTNEVGRLATLVPAFGLAVPSGPVALIEVGASAGLNLYPDRWGYAWTRPTDVSELGGPPYLGCRVTGPAPLPTALPEVAWRAGIDLHPLDVTDADAMAWLETLVWPEQDERRERLAQAVAVARAEPPRIVAGDLLEELPALVGEAAAYGSVIVFHSAVAAYLPVPARERMHAMLTELVDADRCHWISNEAPGIFPPISDGAPAPSPRRFELALDGRVVAHTHGHGHDLRWLTSS
ncbi:MAG TPA: DUF2332 domain-containing protein [Nocardioides bacterium]|uniref:DUF2332 domain-containing protein n=1 Tax=uncultured Nocardioides sp. TaxID=198441 RepID=UPI000EE24F4A|nr:DUF2332 domain-containing protein [uncultured Nocardioides sp.]HCB07678.1 DUF2332 domain-containing protein [Nocardioides sp.]